MAEFRSNRFVRMRESMLSQPLTPKGNEMGRLARIGCTGMLTALIAALGFIMLLGIWTDRSVDYWATQHAGYPVDVNYWWSVLLSLTGPIAFFGNIVTEIMRSVG